MGGVPDQVEGCEPNNDDDKDGKMDKETAQRRFCELELSRRGPRSFRHQTTLANRPIALTRAFGRSPLLHAERLVFTWDPHLDLHQHDSLLACAQLGAQARHSQATGGGAFTPDVPARQSVALMQDLRACLNEFADEKDA
jgi:hypothetical protein